MKKILLIHGWDYDNYYGRTDKEAWNNREKFVKELSKNFIVEKPDLPGFGLNPEPGVKRYTLEDYVDFIHDYIERNKFYPDYILGYSFGGAVAVAYEEKYHEKLNLILVSPAIVRNYDENKKFMKTPKILDFFRNKVRDFYLIYKVKVPEMIYGTKFLRNTYQSIVRVELIKSLEKINPEAFIIVYGSNDDMVDPERVFTDVSEAIRKRIHFIEGGGHDIANTHTEELMDIIKKYDK